MEIKYLGNSSYGEYLLKEWCIHSKLYQEIEETYYITDRPFVTMGDNIGYIDYKDLRMVLYINGELCSEEIDPHRKLDLNELRAELNLPLYFEQSKTYSSYELDLTLELMKKNNSTRYQHILENPILHKEVITHLILKTYPKLIKTISNRYNDVDILIVTWDNRLIVVDLGGSNYLLSYFKKYVTLIHILPYSTQSESVSKWVEPHLKGYLLGEIGNTCEINKVVKDPKSSVLFNRILNCEKLITLNKRNLSKSLIYIKDLSNGEYRLLTRKTIYKIVKLDNICEIDSTLIMNLDKAKETLVQLKAL